MSGKKAKLKILSMLLISSMMFTTIGGFAVKANDGIDIEENGQEVEQSLYLQVESDTETEVYINQKVVLTAEAYGGSGEYVFKYTDTQGNILQDYSDQKEYSFYAQEGENSVLVYAMDTEGNSTYCEYKVIAVTDENYTGDAEGELIPSEEVETELPSSEDNSLEDKEQLRTNDLKSSFFSQMSVELTSSMGTEIYAERGGTLSANVANGQGEILYQFIEEYNGESIVLQDYASESEYSLVTSGIGTHVYYVNVKDGSGNIASASYQLEVVPYPSNTLKGTVTGNQSGSVYVYRGVTLTGKATGGYGELQYRFTEVYNGISKVVQDYSTENDYSFSTSGLGVHTYYVDIKDEEGQSVRVTYTLTVVMNPNAVLKGKVTGNQSGSVYIRRGVTLTGEGTGGYGELQYRFTEVYNGVSKVVQDYSTENDYSFSTSGLGMHTYYVDIKDEEGQSVRVTYTLTVVMNPNAILKGKVTGNQSGSVYIRRGVTLTGEGTGGYGELQYRFTEVYNGVSKVVQDYSTENDYSFSTSGLGMHTYYVDIKDEEGQSVRVTYTLTVVMNPNAVLKGKITGNQSGSVYVQRGVILTGEATGGYGELQYRFTEVYNGASKVVQDYSTDNTYSFSATGPGMHTYYLDIKDEENQNVRIGYSLTVVIHPASVLNGKVAGTQSGGVYIQRGVELTGEATGGYGELQYRFTEVYNGVSKVVQDYGTDNTYSFNTTGPGVHTYYVDIKDEEGQSVRATYILTVLPHPSAILSGKIHGSQSGDVYVQRAVTLKAEATGGYGELQYRFTEVYGGQSTIVKDYSTDTEYSFSTTGPGQHIYYVDIKDEEGQSVRLSYTLNVVVHPNYKLKGTFSTSPSGTATPGQKITLTATSSGGYGSNHQYRFREVYNGKTTILKNYSSAKTCTTTISGGGTHTYYVDIKDSESQILTLSATVNTSLAYTYAANVLNQVGWNLRAAFNWSASLPYVNYSYSPAPGSEAMALYGFQNGVGDCYVMAATFYYMAKTLGYDAHQMAGYVPLSSGGMGVHSWVEIDMNGTTYVFDPDFTNETGRNGYQITYGTSGTWVYSSYYRMN